MGTWGSRCSGATEERVCEPGVRIDVDSSNLTVYICGAGAISSVGQKRKRGDRQSLSIGLSIRPSHPGVRVDIVTPSAVTESEDARVVPPSAVTESEDAPIVAPSPIAESEDAPIVAPSAVIESGEAPHGLSGPAMGAMGARVGGDVGGGGGAAPAAGGL